VIIFGYGRDVVFDMALSDWLARRRAVVWFAAVFLGPVVAGLLTLARAQLHENHVTLVLVLTVAVVSAAGLRPAGLVAAVTTGLAYDYFWIEPYYSFRIFDTQDILTVILLVLVGGAIEQLSWWAGRQRALADRRLGYLTALRRAAEPLAPETHAATLQAISETVANVLGADSCHLVLDERVPATVLHGDGSITRAGRVMNVDTDGLPTDDIIAIPMPRPTGRPGYFAVTAATNVARPRAEQRQVAGLLAHLAAGSLALEAEGSKTKAGSDSPSQAQ
jgi:K+-sensing histidine kinase KdpD